jgi:hypothetical protein
MFFQVNPPEKPIQGKCGDDAEAIIWYDDESIFDCNESIMQK